MSKEEKEVPSLVVWSSRSDIGESELPGLRHDCIKVWNGSRDPDQISLAIHLFLQWIWPPMTDRDKADSLKDLLTGVRNVLKMLKLQILEVSNSEDSVEELESHLEEFANVLSLMDPVVRECPDSGAAVLVAIMPRIYLLSFRTCLSISDCPSSSSLAVNSSCAKNLFNTSQAQMVNFLKVTQAMEEDGLLLDWEEATLTGFNGILEVAQVLILLRFKHFAGTANWIKDFLALKCESNVVFQKKAHISEYANFLAEQSLILVAKLEVKIKEPEATSTSDSQATLDHKKLCFLLEHLEILDRIDGDATQPQQLNCGKVLELLGGLIRLVSFDASVSQGVLERRLIATVPKKVDELLNLIMTRESFSDFLLADPAPAVADEKEVEIDKVSASLSICLVQCEVLRKLVTADEYEAKQTWFASEERNLFRAILLRTQSCSKQEPKESHFLGKDSPLTLPGVQIPGKHLTPVTPYEHILSRLQAFCVGAIKEAFEMIEINLFDIVMSTSSGPRHWSKKISADILCFVARYAGPEICRSHVRFLIDIFQQDPEGFPPNLRLLLERLGRLLAKNSLDEIETSYSPEIDESHLILISILDSSKFSSPFQQKILNRSLSLCRDFASGTLDNLSRLPLVPSGMRVLCKLWYLAESKWTPDLNFMLWQKLASSGLALGTTAWSVELMTELYNLAKVRKIAPEEQLLENGVAVIQQMALLTKSSQYREQAVLLLVNYIESILLSHGTGTNGSFLAEAVKIIITCFEKVKKPGLAALKIVSIVAQCAAFQNSAIVKQHPLIHQIQQSGSGSDTIMLENFSPLEWVLEKKERSGYSKVGRSSKDEMYKILKGALDRALQIEDTTGEVEDIIEQLTALKRKLSF